uniref:TLC domain-containing protein n=1 Tax=Colobus angolensis palliatus TaxID=336983 RepID=A0A2K5IPH3_COLAP
KVGKGGCILSKVCINVLKFSLQVVSTCHSLVVGIFGLYIFLFDEPTKTDPLCWQEKEFNTLKKTVQLSSYLIPYSLVFLTDLSIMILYWKVIGDKFFIIHHCASLYAYYLVLKNGVLVYIGNYRLLAELSSPFVNQRWFFEALKYPKFSKAIVINGILMTVVFFIVRIASMLPHYGFMYSVYGTEPYKRLGVLIQLSWVISCVVLDVMNVMWMIKISKGCIKVISHIKQEKAKNSLQNGKLD